MKSSKVSDQVVAQHLVQAELSLFAQRSQAEIDVLTEYRAQLLSNQAMNSPAAHTPPSSSLSAEERAAIIEKLGQISQLSSVSLDTSECLYLEQQLSELLGFEVSAKHGGQVIHSITANVGAGSHILRTPRDTLERHQRVPEAGITRHRSQFGWQLSSSASSGMPDETYGVSISLRNLQVGPEKTLSELLAWYSQQKLLILNSADLVAAVASITDTFIDTSDKYQFLASPELIRDTSLWSLNNKGRAVVFFVPDPDNIIDTGIYNLT